MQHEIKQELLGPFEKPIDHAIQTCVHCGFCLPACPTYQVMGEEMDSPRGRIFLMKETLEGRLEFQDTAEYIDRCLGCVGCITACPSGVPYGELVTAYRAVGESKRARPFMERLLRWFVLSTLPYPGRFRWAMRLGKLSRPLQFLAPKSFRGALDLLPDRLPPAAALPEKTAARGERRARVALLVGCAQQVLAPDINLATIRVLERNGVEVVVPPTQACCGALAAHTGVMDQAKMRAKQNLRAFPKDVDAILTNAAGCGSGMHEYALWLTGEPEEEEAKSFVSKVMDVSRFLVELGIEAPPATKQIRIAYHDACHLAHAQNVRQQPRELLRSIPGVELVEVPNGEMCCGSAGTYNLEQPETAKQLGQEKSQAIASVKPDLVATGNIGCMTQIDTHLNGNESQIPVLHTIQVLDKAYQRTLDA